MFICRLYIDASYGFHSSMLSVFYFCFNMKIHVHNYQTEGFLLKELLFSDLKSSSLYKQSSALAINIHFT